MIQATNPQQQEVVQSFQLKHMDLPSPRFFHPHQAELKPSFNGIKNNSNIYNNPFADTFPDPLCKLNLKETSEFVRSLPPIASDATMGSGSGSALRKREGMGCHQKLEAPPTPGRPIFSFGVAGKPRKSVPSKWDDAEKWLISSSTDSPAHHHAFKPNFKQEQCTKVSDPKLAPGFRGFLSSSSSSSLECHSVMAGATAGGSESDDVLLKDKLTDNEQPILPNLRFLMAEPPKEDFLARNSSCNSEIMKVAAADTGVVQVQHRDVGTEMTPLGSSTTSRCPTPFKSISPARHNTPASRSGPLSASADYCFDMSQLQEYCSSDLGNKLQLGATKFDSCVSNWSSREEEEEEVSKSLRHFETGNECNKNAPESRASEWEEDERKKSCLRYQREEAKIQAWVNLQNAKAEARSKKLEVKIQKMRSNLEEKLMKRMAVVHRKAEEWRATAQLQHCQQIQKVGEEVQSTVMSHHNPQYLSGRRVLCGCLPCTNHRY